ncbi:MAG: 3-deoxy-7-phosphoheptulonate synthase [Candidatus Cryptobacteroides sp.]|nr:3-deoxy-7-phosphoheptulonate synthase [Candidatus Cryptobacteroides sp.]
MKTMNFKRELFSPQEIKSMYPVPSEAQSAKKANDEQIRSVLDGRSDKLLLIIGPCSADREDSVIDYISRLRPVQEKVADKIVIIPRIYTNKPRTTGAGYKGMLHQPDPIQSPDIFKGLIAIRRLHLRALTQTGFSAADEMLYPENHLFLSDLLSYVAVGARSVENQQHRLVASGLDVPVGMKNPTGGDISVMMNSIKAAQSGHSFIYRNWEVESTGNPYAHAILRGFVDNHGTGHPNYHYEDLRHLDELYQAAGLQNPGVIVDCNHSNSGKKYIEQGRIAKEVIHSTSLCEPTRRLVKGLMIESYIEDGSQKAGECIYGKSITDPCLGWEKTERLIYDLAELW